MIYPDVSLQEWSAKHHLDVETKLCSNCRDMFQTTVPILIRGYAGLETPIHRCGSKFKAAVFAPISEEKLHLWKEVI